MVARPLRVAKLLTYLGQYQLESELWGVNPEKKNLSLASDALDMAQGSSTQSLDMATEQERPVSIPWSCWFDNNHGRGQHGVPGSLGRCLRRAN